MGRQDGLHAQRMTSRPDVASTRAALTTTDSLGGSIMAKRQITRPDRSITHSQGGRPIQHAYAGAKYRVVSGHVVWIMISKGGR